MFGIVRALIGAGMLLIGTIAMAETVADVAKLGADKDVSLAGTVVSFQASRSDRAPNSFRLKDATGEIRVAVWNDVLKDIANKDAIKAGAQLSVKGTIKEFKGALEVHVNSAGDVVVGGAAPAPAAAPAAVTAAAASTPATVTATPATVMAAAAGAPASAPASRSVQPINGLTRDKLKSEATIAGKVASVRVPRTETAPYVIKVTDATGSIDVVFWKDIADQLSTTQKAVQGDTIQVKGQLDEYRGTLQLKLMAPADLQTGRGNPAVVPAADKATSASQPQASARATLLSEIASAAADSRLRVAGHVTAVTPIRAGKRVELEDASGTATILLWDTAVGLMPEVRNVQTSKSLVVAGSVQQSQIGRVLVVAQPEDVIAMK